MRDSLKLKVTAVIVALGLLGIALDVSKIHGDWLITQEAKSLSAASHALARLSDASIRMSAERSLTQLTLSLDEPIAKEFRAKIDEQRRLVDADFNKAMDFLADDATSEFKKVTAIVQDELNKLSGLRTEADRLLGLPRIERPNERITGIPDALKSLVTQLHAARLQLRGSGSNIMTTVVLLEQAQDRALKLREYAGRDRTYVATALARKERFEATTLASMVQLNGRAYEAMTELEALTDHDEMPESVRASVAELKSNYFGTYAKLRNAILAEGQNDAPVYAISFADFFTKSSDALKGAEDLGNLISTKIEDFWAEQEAHASFAIVKDSGTLTMLVGLSAAAVWVVFALFRRLDRLRLAMGSLASGSLSIVVPELATRDEIGEMARTVKHFQDVGQEKLAVEAAAQVQRAAAEAARERAAEEKARLEREAEAERRKSDQLKLAAAEEEAKASAERAQAIEKIGSGLSRLAVNDLSFRLTGDMPQAYRQLMEDFNSAVANLSSTLAAIREGTAAIASGTREISQAADDLSRRTEGQAANLEETTGAVVEISNAVKVSAQNAVSARDYVGEANKDAAASSQIVDNAVTAMTEIATSSKEIGQIIGVIDEIAFQTSLLALNAGVEAARAGEAGRGFAVVATEVRALAQRSADAAKQIRTLITMSSDQVNRGVSLVGEAGQSLQRIMTRITEINTLVTDISGRANEQSMGLSQVSTTVTQMDQATQQNAAMVEQTTAATRSLSDESQKLLLLVSKFKLGGPSDDHILAGALAMAAPHMRKQLNLRA